MGRSINLFIEDILDSIKKIESFSKRLTKEKLFNNDLRQSAIIRQIEIIEESIKNIPNYFRDKYPEIPWKDFSGIRDIITHGYFKVDLGTIWSVIKQDLPDLKQKILKIKRDIEEQEKELKETRGELKKEELE